MKTNKKLIKQLKRCGFEKRFTTGRGVYYSDQEVMKWANPFCAFYAESDTFEVYLHSNGPEVDIKSPTFAQIAAAIKEHTGEELKPKPTKAQRIEALTKRIEALEQKDKDVPTITKEEAKQLDWEAKEYEKDSKRCLQKLDEMATKGLKQEHFFGIDYGTSSDPIDALSYAMHGVGEPRKKDVETEPVFEVRDRVVINLKHPELAEHYSIKNAAIEKQVCQVAAKNSRGYKVKINFNNANSFYWYFQEHELQHAPKEAAKVLKFGKEAELLYTIDSDYCEGATVLICDTIKGNGYFGVIVNGRGETSVNGKYLKPL